MQVNIKSNGIIGENETSTMGYAPEAILNSVRPLNRCRLEQADGIGTTKNPMENEMIEVSVRLGRHGKRITHARFQAVGCPALVATGSMVTQLLKDQDVEACRSLTAARVDDSLGALPALRRYCAYMGAEAARRAIQWAVTRRRYEGQRVEDGSY